MSNSISDNHLHKKSLTLAGQGQVLTTPNVAIIRLGVQSTGENLSNTQTDNAIASQNILESLKRMGLSDIKTYQYNIDKNYEYVEGTRIDKGYIVRNIFELKINNMEQVGIAIDTAVNNGANVVDFIAFEVSHPEVYYQQALNMAIMNAFQKAKSILSGLGSTMDPVPLRIVENSLAPMPTSQISVAREQFSTPIEPGQKRIDAFVTVEFDL